MADSLSIHTQIGVGHPGALEMRRAAADDRRSALDAYRRAKEIAERTWDIGIGDTTEDRDAEMLGIAVAVALGGGMTLSHALVASGVREAVRRRRRTPQWLRIEPAELDVVTRTQSIFTSAVAKLAALCDASPCQGTAGLRWLAYEAARDLPALLVDRQSASVAPTDVSGELAIATARGAAEALSVSLAVAAKRGMREAAVAHAAGISEVWARQLLMLRDDPWALLVATARAVAAAP